MTVLVWKERDQHRDLEEEVHEAREQRQEDDLPEGDAGEDGEGEHGFLAWPGCAKRPYRAIRVPAERGVARAHDLAAARGASDVGACPRTLPSPSRRRKRPRSRHVGRVGRYGCVPQGSRERRPPAEVPRWLQPQHYARLLGYRLCHVAAGELFASRSAGAQCCAGTPVPDAAPFGNGDPVPEYPVRAADAAPDRAV